MYKLRITSDPYSGQRGKTNTKIFGNLSLSEEEYMYIGGFGPGDPAVQTVFGTEPFIIRS